MVLFRFRVGRDISSGSIALRSRGRATIARRYNRWTFRAIVARLGRLIVEVRGLACGLL